MTERPGMFRSWAEAAPFLCAVGLTWAFIIGGLAYWAISLVPTP